MLEHPKKLPPPATELAVRYGVWDVPPFKGLGKSGFTPVTPEPQKKESWRPEEAAKYYETRSLAEESQRRTMMLWTALELKTLHAHAAYGEFKPITLTNPIHPVFALSQWVKVEKQYWHLAPIPIGSGISGFWEAQNPVVWKLLEPSLRFASMCLENIHVWPWWDALINSEPQEIFETNNVGLPVHRMNQGKGLYRLKIRRPQLQARDRNKSRDAILAAARYIKLSFGDGYTSPFDDTPSSPLWAGVTSDDVWAQNISIRIDHHTLAPILLSNTTKGEEILAQWSVGLTLVHELAHALWMMRMRQEPACRDVSNEPYFEEEPVSELGNSVANALLNGSFFPIYGERSYRGEYPFAGSVRLPWPLTGLDTDNPRLYDVNPMAHDYAYAVPIEYYWRLLQADFWEDHVPVFGLEALFIDPLLIGHGLDIDGGFVLTRDNPNPFPDPVKIDKSRRVWTDISRLWKELDDSWAKRQADWEGFRAVVEAAIKGTPQQNLSPPPPEVDSVEVFYPPQRHEEITRTIIANRQKLAIHTQDFAMPELTLLSHVNRLDVMKIERGEWREYLLFMTYTKQELLQFNPYPGGGTVSINLSAGWPQLLFPDEAPAVIPSNEHIAIMENHMAHLAPYCHYVLDYPDYDQEAVRSGINLIWNVFIGQIDFFHLTNWYIWRRRFWRNAPPGIMRVRKPFDLIKENEMLREEAKNIAADVAAAAVGANEIAVAENVAAAEAKAAELKFAEEARADEARRAAEARADETRRAAEARADETRRAAEAKAAEARLRGEEVEAMDDPQEDPDAYAASNAESSNGVPAYLIEALASDDPAASEPGSDFSPMSSDSSGPYMPPGFNPVEYEQIDAYMDGALEGADNEDSEEQGPDSNQDGEGQDSVT